LLDLADCNFTNANLTNTDFQQIPLNKNIFDNTASFDKYQTAA
jgi:uncharacterized protein YjbI with pentapeptide repeats